MKKRIELGRKLLSKILPALMILVFAAAMEIYAIAAPSKPEAAVVITYTADAEDIVRLTGEGLSLENQGSGSFTLRFIEPGIYSYIITDRDKSYNADVYVNYEEDTLTANVVVYQEGTDKLEVIDFRSVKPGSPAEPSKPSGPTGPEEPASPAGPENPTEPIQTTTGDQSPSAAPPDSQQPGGTPGSRGDAVPQSADTNNVMLYVILAAFAAVVMIVSLTVLRRSVRSNKGDNNDAR